ncbi:hypothetical protein ABFB09_05740 [Dehalogenimonas sp. THU2]|uniref:InlB B-repeat-containing protein n=1 Tax=Dehalogenimonas sp. THU2 TaxID=3151121 RepID=UPI00321845E5
MNRTGHVTLIIVWCITLIACSPVISDSPNADNNHILPTTSSVEDRHDDTVTPVATTFTLTLFVSGEGQVIPAKGTYRYVSGTVVDLTAVAIEGWVFNIWIGNVDNTMDNPTTVTMNCNQTVMAYFSDAND